VAATRMVISDERKRAIRLWARRRAEGKSEIARRIKELHYAGQTHEQIRISRGLTVDRYKRAKRWLADALAQTSDYVTFEEALRQHAERQVELVMRFGHLRERGAGEREIREHLGLTEEGYNATRSWWMDGLAATEVYEGEKGL
jgi:hypothetical protein